MIGDGNEKGPPGNGIIFFCQFLPKIFLKSFDEKYGLEVYFGIMWECLKQPLDVAELFIFFIQYDWLYLHNASKSWCKMHKFYILSFQ